MTNTEVTMNAEISLAGAILVDARCMEAVPITLSDGDFLSESCRTVYRAARDLEKKEKTIDPVTVLDWAVSHSEPLTRDTVIEMMETVPSCNGVGDYARMVQENALRRRLQKAAAKLSQDDRTPLVNLGETVEHMEALLSSADQVQLNNLGQVGDSVPRWLLEPYFPRGKGTLVQAEPGTGKTALMCAVAAAVTSAKPILGMRIQTPGDVLLLSTEDDLSTLKGRLVANGGDPRRVHFLRKMDDVTMDSPILEQAIRASHAKLVILDPLQAFLGRKVDMHRANETRPILAKLFAVCEKYDCACVIIAHLAKNVLGKSPVTQSLGSVDIPGAMRSILHVVRNPQCEGEILAFHVKSSNAPMGKPLAFTIGDWGGVTFTGFSDMTIADLGAKEEKEYDDYDHEPLVQVFHQMLADYPKGGFWSYEDLRNACKSILGFCSYSSSREMRNRLDAPGFARELLERDKIQLTTGVKNGGRRGIRLENYTVPTAYQIKLP